MLRAPGPGAICRRGLVEEQELSGVFRTALRQAEATEQHEATALVAGRHRFANGAYASHQSAKAVEGQRLGTVTLGQVWIGMHLYYEAVSSCCCGCHGHGSHHEGPPGRMAGVCHDKQVTQAVHGRDCIQVEGIASEASKVRMPRPVRIT